MKTLKLNYAPLFLMIVGLVACGKPAPPVVVESGYYTCSMHPQIREKAPGPCPICKMPMVQVVNTPDKKANELRISCEQIRLANIQTDTVRLRPLGEEITLPATLREDQTGINTVTVWLTGRLERLYVRNVGKQVRVGQAVFDLYSEDLAVAQGDFLLALQSKKRYSGTDLDFTRIALAARNKLLLWGMTEAQLGELERSGTPTNTVTFYSRYAGYITETPPAEGSYVAEGATVLKLADLRTLWPKRNFTSVTYPF